MSAVEGKLLSTTFTKPEDDLDIHEVPGRRQLSPEAKLISKLMENCIGQVEIVAILPAVLSLNSESGVSHKELSRSLQQHQILEERLEALVVKDESDGEQEGEVGKVRKKARAQVEKGIKDSLRNLLRLTRAHPEAISGLKADLGMQVGESGLVQALKNFHSKMLETLLMSVEEEQKLALCKPVSLSTSYNLKDLVSKEEEYVKAIENLDSQMSQTKVEVGNMEDYLHMRHLASVLAEKQRQSLIKTSMTKQSGIQQNINQLNTQLDNLMLGNRQTERPLQQKNEETRTEIEYLLQIFDDEIGKHQVNLELNATAFEKEEEEVEELKKPFSFLEEATNRIQEKRRLAEEKRKEEMRELELKTKAAIFAQAWWRGYSTRKALKNQSKSKKGKKGKGKKTK